MSPTPYLLVLTTAPDLESGQAIARGLVEQRLAACVSVLPDARSFYWWEEKLNAENECVLLIKTRADLFEPLEQGLKALHPYSVPELIALPVERGSADYLAWLDKETRG